MRFQFMLLVNLAVELIILSNGFHSLNSAI